MAVCRVFELDISELIFKLLHYFQKSISKIILCFEFRPKPL